MTALDIIQARKRLGLTQAEAARLVGVKTNTWSQWEQGRRRPTGPAIKMIELLSQEKLRS